MRACMQMHRPASRRPATQCYKPGSKFTSFELAEKTVAESRATMTAKYVCAGSSPLTVPLRLDAGKLCEPVLYGPPGDVPQYTTKSSPGFCGAWVQENVTVPWPTNWKDRTGAG